MVGVPARCIKRRFSDEIIEGLERTQWWNLPEEELKSAKELVSDPSKFIKKFEKNREQYNNSGV